MLNQVVSKSLTRPDLPLLAFLTIDREAEE